MENFCYWVDKSISKKKPNNEKEKAGYGTSLKEEARFKRNGEGKGERKGI